MTKTTHSSQLLQLQVANLKSAKKDMLFSHVELKTICIYSHKRIATRDFPLTSENNNCFSFSNSSFIFRSNSRLSSPSCTQHSLILINSSLFSSNSFLKKDSFDCLFNSFQHQIIKMPLTAKNGEEFCACSKVLIQVPKINQSCEKLIARKFLSFPVSKVSRRDSTRASILENFEDRG